MHGWRRAPRDGARDKGLGRTSLIGASRSRDTAAAETVEPPKLTVLWDRVSYPPINILRALGATSRLEMPLSRVHL